MFIICYPAELPTGGGPIRTLNRANSVSTRTLARAHGTRPPCTRSVLPDVDHLGLVRHDGCVSPDRVDPGEDELDHELVSDLENPGNNPPFHRIRA